MNKKKKERNLNKNMDYPHTEGYSLFYFYLKKNLEIGDMNKKLSLRHYLNMPFTDTDRMLMKEYVEGWI